MSIILNLLFSPKSVFLLLAATFGFLAIAEASESLNKKILIIHSYSSEENKNWVTDMSNGVKDTLGNEYEYFQFEMRTKVLPKSMHKERADKALDYYRKIKPELVFLTDDNALKLTSKQIIKDTPVVYMGINGSIRNDYPWVMASNNATGIIEKPLIQRSLVELNKALNNRLKKVLLLMGDSPSAKAIHHNELNDQEELELYGSEIHIRRGNLEKWYKHVSSAKYEGFDAILATTFFTLRDSMGHHVSSTAFSEWLSKNSPIPVLTVHGEHIGKDRLVGGVVLSGFRMGREAGLLAEQILERNKPAGTIYPHSYDDINVFFSKSQLTKWHLNLNEKELKSGAIILVD